MFFLFKNVPLTTKVDVKISFFSPSVLTVTCSYRAFHVACETDFPTLFFHEYTHSPSAPGEIIPHLLLWANLVFSWLVINCLHFPDNIMQQQSNHFGRKQLSVIPLMNSPHCRWQRWCSQLPHGCTTYSASKMDIFKCLVCYGCVVC